jgi:seryl-tRNA synthetase
VLDLRWVVQNLDEVRTRLQGRGGGAAAELLSIDQLAAERRRLIHESESARAEQKKGSDQMRTLRGEEQAALRARLKEIASGIKPLEEKLAEVEQQIEHALLRVPNLPHPTVPPGKSAEENVEVAARTFGKAPSFAFAPREHTALGEALGLLDFERAAKISGARFAVLKGDLARLERALVSFFLDVHRERGYDEVLTPYLVNEASMRGTGQLPKFEEDLFKTKNGETPLYLIPTAEVPVTNLHRDEILGDPGLPNLPIRYSCFSPCFRSEAGSYGKDVKGLIRMHQFHKVELVRFEAPEQSQAALEQLVDDAQEPLKRLGLHHRVVLLCGGDMGFSAEKTYDLEVWLPGQQAFREISSCSSFGDFQARRAQIRYRPAAGEKPRLLHTLNGSGLAVGRTLVALLENYQEADGSVLIPEALRPYLGGLERLTPRR